MSTVKVAFKEAGWVFFISRLVILILTYLSSSIIPDSGKLFASNCFTTPRNCLQSWMHYDVFSYIYIAMRGYDKESTTAFFPLWPLLLHGLSFFVGGSTVRYYLIGVVLANFFSISLLLYFICSVTTFLIIPLQKKLCYI